MLRQNQIQRLGKDIGVHGVPYRGFDGIPLEA